MGRKERKEPMVATFDELIDHIGSEAERTGMDHAVFRQLMEDAGATGGAMKVDDGTIEVQLF